MKRNDVVYSKRDEKRGSAFYGRIWKTLSDGRHVVVCCGARVRVYSEDELILSDYKGREWHGRFIHMTSLRHLKLRASLYSAHFGPYRNAWGHRWTPTQTRQANFNLSKELVRERQT